MHANAQSFGRNVKDICKKPVPEHQTPVAADHTNPLPGVIQRGLQHIAVILHGRIGIIEQAQGLFG